jgi:hypothetical protein
MPNVQGYDFETLCNCFTATFVHTETGEQRQFVIHDLWDDRIEFFNFLDDKTLRLVGFNNLRFDYPVLHWIMENEFELMKYGPDRAARMIYARAQEVISTQWPEIKKRDTFIPQCDVYRIHHFDNPAKHASLKWIQSHLRWRNVQDMPHHHSQEVKTIDEIKMILGYNANDVLSTLELYKKSRREIDMRHALKAKYGVDVLNANDPKMGQELILSFLAKKKGVSIWDLKKMRTFRAVVDIGECISDKIAFKSRQFSEVLSSMKKIRVIDPASGDKFKGKFAKKANFGGMKYAFGLGGLHGCLKPTIWYSDDKYDIMSCDVSSYYPNIAIKGKFYPEHFGLDFCEVYEWVYTERKNYPKKSAENGGLKLALNGTFGKTNDLNSPFYDPVFTMQITANGQLMLAELCEEIVLSGVGIILMANTDGIEVKVDKKRKDEYLAICKRWEEKWQMTLEHAKYKALATRDVNNYIGIFEGEFKDPADAVKCKGAYEVDKPYHKDPSMRVCAIAAREFIVNKTPIEKTILNHKDTYDFMIVGRTTSEDHFQLRTAFDRQEVGKNLRYVVSNTGDYLYKIYGVGKEERVSSGERVRVYNELKEVTDINYQYYIKEARALIAPMTSPQLSLL